MANYTDFTLNLSGHPFKLKQARDKLMQSEYHHNFSIADIHDEQFTHEPPTWYLHGEGRWGVELDKLVDFLAPYQLTGTLVDTEYGSDFFCKVWLDNGVVTNNINVDFVSDEHYEHCPDHQFWLDSLDYALDEPDICEDQINFMLKHNIITQEYLDECIQKNKSNQQ